MCRLWDTRNPPGPLGGPKLGANTIRCFPVSGVCGVPNGARALVINAGAMGATDSGTLRFFASGTVPLPTSPALGFKPTVEASANGLIVAMAGSNQICVRTDMPQASVGNVHSMTDVIGYYAGRVH
jgi:hypothetical protein